MTVDGLLAVFMTNRAALVRFLRARGAGDDADDIAQDLWVKLAAGGQGPIADPLAYLYRMANNLMIDRHRMASRRRDREQSWITIERGGDDVSDEPSAERRLLSRERLAEIDGRIDALGPRTSAIFRRFRLDGVSHGQIAAEHGISVSAIEKHLRKAYRILSAIGADDAAAEDPERLDRGGANDAAG
ncbi:MAG: sigma-70 family RNA polymerase sigma factor [Sphingomonadaceae bacterium]|nr:sigma-70 family RNA polymerase sigma factor [Sphingomonadaceae bacterium]